MTTATTTAPTFAAPVSLMSLQPVKKSQVMVPDDRGILRPHQVRTDTAKFISNIIAAEENMDAMTQSLNTQAQGHAVAIPSPSSSAGSLAAAPSTSSVASGTSGGSAGTQTGDKER